MLAASYLRVFETYELQSYDWRCWLRGPRPVSERVVFIDIWDDAVRELGAWPFNRAFHAELIKALKAGGAKAVAFDVIFVEPREGDDAMQQAARAAGNVYVASAFRMAESRSKSRVFVADAIVAETLPALVSSALGHGHVNAKADADGKVRRVIPAFTFNPQDPDPSTPEAIGAMYGKKTNQLALEIAHRELGTDLSKLPVDEDGYYIVSYSGTWGKSKRWSKPFRHYSYLDVIVAAHEGREGLKPRLNLSIFKDTFCFVGLASEASHDTKPTPLESVYPMVGLHGNILNNVLTNDYIRRLPRLWNALLLALLTGFILWICRRFRPLQALAAVLGTLAAYVGIVTLLFILLGWWIDMFFPFVVAIGIYAIATLGQVIVEMQKREVLEKELKIASQIQQSFLPETVPSHANFEIAVYMKPAKAVGGDLYAFLPLAGDKLGVMVGDVSGKGTPAALFMAKAVSEFKFSARDKQDPSVVLSAANDSISAESTGGLFVTMSYLVFDPKARRMTLSNGGHLPAVHVDAGGRSELLQAEEGMPIGVMPGIPFANFEQPLKAGDVFALYSDGVSEARNRKKDEFGIEALQRVMTAARAGSSAQILEATVAELNRFMGKADQHDDITLIIIKVNSL